MKNYVEKNAGNLNAAKLEVLNNFSADFVGSSVNSTSYGAGVIIDVINVSENVACDNYTFNVEIKFDNGDTRQFQLVRPVATGFIKLQEDKVNLFNEYVEQLTSMYKAFQNKRIESSKLAAQEAKEVLQRRDEVIKEKQLKKEQQKIEDRKKAQLEAANKLGKCEREINNHYYHALGYIAKHAKNITAAMPDYLEKWFVTEFGDVPHKAVSQDKLSPSGLPSQFALYLKIDLDTNDNLPGYLQKYLGNVEKDVKPISNTQFIFCLLKHEGFCFGKEQDVSRIIDCVPKQFIKDFQAGYDL